MDPILTEAIEAVLEANPDGLVEREIRRLVLRNNGLRRQPKEILAVLQGHPNLFLGPLADHRWRLKAVMQTEEIIFKDLPAEALRQERGQVEVPYLAHLPPLDSFIAFDLETTGVDPTRDQIIQISAVRIVNGQPASWELADGEISHAVFNEYVRLDGRELAYGLKVKLGFIDHPQWLAALEMADGLADVLGRFQIWAGDLALVAHNARFDYQFLQEAGGIIGWQIPANRIVDSLELACLALPQLSSFKLEELAGELDIKKDRPSGDLVEMWAEAEGISAFDWGGFHNAVVDVLVLAALVPILIDRLQQRLRQFPQLAWLGHLLLPRLSQVLAIVKPQVDESLDQMIKGMAGERGEAPMVFSEPVLIDYSPEREREHFETFIDNQGLKQRESQLEMVSQVARALQADRFMLIEAPTGTGKTFAYLFSSIAWALSRMEPVVISTHTRLLQDQMHDDVRWLKNHLGIEFQAQVLKGMPNYICLERTAAIFAQIDLESLDDEERFGWFYLLSWLATTADGLLDELSYWAILRFPILAQIRDSLRAERGECSQQRCANCRLCFHKRAYDHAATADIVIMNHALLLAKDWPDEGFPFRRAIIDEAHNLEDAATSAATEEVSYASINLLINRLLDQRSGQGALIRLRDQIKAGEGQRIIAVAMNQRRLLKSLVQDFGGQLKRYVEQNKAAVDPHYGAKLALESDPQRANPVSWQPVQKARKRLVGTLEETGSAVRHLANWIKENQDLPFQEQTLNELYYLADKLVNEAALLTNLLRVQYDPLVQVHWLEVERAISALAGEEEKAYSGPYRWAVKRAPVMVGDYLQNNLYQDKQSLVFTSATLRTTLEAGFSFLLERLGLVGRVHPEDAIFLPAELDYSRALFGIARYMRSDARPAEKNNFVDEVGQELGWFYRFTGGEWPGFVYCAGAYGIRFRTG